MAGWTSADVGRALTGRLAAHLLVGVAAVLVAADLEQADAASGRPSVVFRVVAPVLLLAAAGAAWRRARQGLSPALDRRFAMGCCAVVLALAAIGPVRGSKDLWAYAMYGRIQSTHHADPYVHAPEEFPDDPYLARMNPIWTNQRSVYGPVFNDYAAVITRLAGDSADGTRLAFKGTAALSMLGALLVLRRRRVDPTAIAFVGLHPAVAHYAVAGGHNDAIVGLAVLGGVVLVTSRRPVWAGLLLAAGALVKVVIALPALALAVWLWHRPDPDDRRAATLFVGAFGAVTAVGYLLLAGPAAVGPLFNASDMTSATSFWRPLHDGPLGDATTFLAVGAVLSLVALLLRGRRRDTRPEELVVSVLLAYVAVSSYALVWYLVWLLPVAALRWRSLTGVLAAWLATAYVLPVGWRPVLQLTALAVAVALAVDGRRRARSTSGAQSTNSSSTASAQVQ